jgi:hypothetical protein
MLFFLLRFLLTGRLPTKVAAPATPRIDLLCEGLSDTDKRYVHAAARMGVDNDTLEEFADYLRCKAERSGADVLRPGSRML